jgi:hypothetical protein
MQGRLTGGITCDHDGNDFNKQPSSARRIPDVGLPARQPGALLT